MSEISVSAERDYVVRIAGDWRGDLSAHLSAHSRVAIIHSAAMSAQIGKVTHNHAEIFTFEVPDGEAGKSHQTITYLWNELARAGFTRSDLIVGIGGGTVTDLAGFAAASWLRGIDWVAVPTTVAGMVDAAIGGKTGINSPMGKNLIGAFHSPKAVIIDHHWLATLSDRDFAAGLAEVIKCGFISDPAILTAIEGKNLSQIRTNPALVHELIERAITVKAVVVSSDFKESHLREILNYGHTFGHAIERVSNYSIRHGEAVSIGMVFIAHLSRELELIDEELLQRHITALSAVGLPTSMGAIDGGSNWAALLAAIALDKKSRGAQLRFVALDGLGSCTRIEGVLEEQLQSAYEKVLS